MARQGAVVDLRPVAVGHQAAVFDPAGEAHAFQIGAKGAEIGGHEIGRLGIERPAVAFVRREGAAQLGLVIAGEDALGLVVVADSQGREMALQAGL